MADDQRSPPEEFLLLRVRLFALLGHSDSGVPTYMWAVPAQCELHDLLPQLSSAPDYAITQFCSHVTIVAHGANHHIALPQLTAASLILIHSQLIAGQAAVVQFLEDERKAKAAPVATVETCDGGGHAVH